jgi:hypothetical protein
MTLSQFKPFKYVVLVLWRFDLQPNIQERNPVVKRDPTVYHDARSRKCEISHFLLKTGELGPPEILVIQPSYVDFRQPNTRYFVWLQGTTSPVQLAKITTEGWWIPQTYHDEFYDVQIYLGDHSGAGAWGTALQAVRSRVRFRVGSWGFLINLTLTARARDLRSAHLTEMNIRGLLGVKAAGAWGWLSRKSGSLTLLNCMSRFVVG